LFWLALARSRLIRIYVLGVTAVIVGIAAVAMLIAVVAGVLGFAGIQLYRLAENIL
jgi:hypothetical protein